MTSVAQPYAAADGLVRVYPAGEPDGTGLVWAHGGGFAGGDLDMAESDAVARALAASGTTVVSVDYRLAPTPAAWAAAAGVPQHDGVHYPAASDDLVAAWQWTVANADDLGIRSLALGGTSAGGNLAAGAALCLLHGARNGGTETLPDLVILAYPTLHAVQATPSPDLRAALDADPEADRFGPAAVLGMYENYLGGPVVGADVYAIPGLASTAELEGFPRTYVINGDVDELRVSGEAFAASLAAAGVDVEVELEPGTQHGHLNRPEAPAFAASITRIRARLATLADTTLTPTPAAHLSQSSPSIHGS
ncbi:alpha/beta hydrolase fold domain-containing protein [Microbacterium sp. bgisy189]|uniref:alpha/beta hydrolase fold domain-containing protein n=1 Tax=Microbacterium sp. bgisy189 TaxID=3413798 RepID=UPI003EC13D7B